jgi:PAS domain S-box-containing protein
MVYFALYKPKTQQIQQEIYLEQSIQLKKTIQYEISKKQGRTAALTYLLSKDKKLIEALIKKDRTLIDYKPIIKGIEKQDSYKDLWIQVINKEGYSFYRSWTNKVGDHAASARMDIAKMLKEPKPMNNISTGRFDMTFKTMLPLYDIHDNLLGMIEMISHFNSIASELKNNGIEPIIIVDESYTKRFIKPFSGLFIGNNYIANINASKVLMDKVKEKGIDKFLNIKEYMIFEDYLVTIHEIKNIKNGPMGFFTVFVKTDSIDMAKLSKFQIEFLTILVVVLIIFILFIALLINKGYVKRLNKKVDEKTFEINEQKENLKSLLAVYDKNVIFSKTDTKGYITDVSDAFCKISGYDRSELIGKNHNIIRHPDMPKKSFKYLWKELKKEHSVRLEVKNRKKDGGYYWVDAEFEPEYDSTGKHIGYTAVRQDITSNKDVEEIQKEIIFAMGSIGEGRSQETANHVRRVAEYSKLLAIKYGLHEDEAEMLKQASPMHDIGKVAIADSILNKPSRLNDDEMSVMKTHALKGYEMLNISDRPLLKMAATIALDHHEKWDGTGYPNNLKEEEISIYGRITAVADVFDALGSKRCYKDAWDDESIFKLFKDEKGKHFDPKLVDIFFENLDDIMKIREKFKDNF